MGQVTPGRVASDASLAARAVSVLTFPPLVALPAFLLLTISFADSSGRWIVVATALAFGVAWPVMATIGLILRRDGKGIEGPRVRLARLGLGVLGYAVGVGALVSMAAPLVVTLLMFCYASNTAVLLAVNALWKASAHAMGVAGPTIALVFGFGAWGALLSLLLPAVGWSRIRLGAHNLAQIVVGAGLGYVLTGLQFSLGLRLF